MTTNRLISALREKTEALQTTLLVLQGFRFQYAKQYLQLNKDSNCRGKGIRKELFRMLPFNAEFDKMFEDVLSTNMVLSECSDCFSRLFAIRIKRNGDIIFCPLGREPEGKPLAAEDVLTRIRQKGVILVRPGKNSLNGRGRQIVYRDGIYYIDGVRKDENQLLALLHRLPISSIMMEQPSPSADVSSKYDCRFPILHIVAVNPIHGDVKPSAIYIAEHDDGGRVALYSGKISSKAVDLEDARVRNALKFVQYVCGKFREIEYLNVSFVLTENGFSVFQIDTGLDIACMEHLPQEVEAFLSRRMAEYKDKKRSTIQILKRYGFSLIAKKKGFVDFMYRNWLRGLREDNQLACTSRKEKRWAHRRGFYSYRIKQYNLTDANCHQFLSDYDYKRLRPLNSEFQKWFWNKIISYYVLQPFGTWIPTYYFRVMQSENGKAIVPFDGEGQKVCTGEDVLRLLRKTGLLAVKPAIGSHGKGFHKLSFDAQSQSYCMDDQNMKEQEVLRFINGLDAGSIISEYIVMHKNLMKIYDKVVCTIRVMVIRDNTSSLIKNAYLRIGTFATGNTDNLGSGGAVAPIELESGRFENARLLIEHEYRPCVIHPDTGAKIEGVIPYWEETKRAIQAVCHYLPVLEYLGFDVAITENGPKIIEINTHQDLHMYRDYPQDVKDYFRKRMTEKKKQ